jgi:hypothetical protein
MVASPMLVAKGSIVTAALGAGLACACSPPRDASTVVRSPAEISSATVASGVASLDAPHPDESQAPQSLREPEEQSRDAGPFMFLEGPFSGGVAGGLGGVAFSNGAAHTTGAALGLPTTGALGPRLGLTFRQGYFFAAASYDYSLLFGQGGWHHAAATLGACLPGVITPFLGLSLRVWALEIDPRAGETQPWQSGVRASAALDGGLRITPWLRPGKGRRSSVLVGPIVRASVPVAGGGGWTVSANLVLGGSVD